MVLWINVLMREQIIFKYLWFYMLARGQGICKDSSSALVLCVGDQGREYART